VTVKTITRGTHNMALPAKLLALAAYRLLRDGTKEAGTIRNGFSPVYSKEQYVRDIEAMRG